MNQVPKHLIEAAALKGIVPGAEVSCYITPSDTGIVPPVEKWEKGSGGWFFVSDEDNGIYVVADDNSRFAKVIQPTTSQGLEEGMATECSPAMRAAIIELAKELGIGTGGVPPHDNRLLGVKCTKYSHGIEIVTKMAEGMGRHTLLTPEDFIAKMRATAKKPKPIKIGNDVVVFNKGSIKVGCTTIPNETVRAIADKLQD